MRPRPQALTQALERAPAMGQIGDLGAPLVVVHHGEGRGGVEHLAGQHDGEQLPDLGDRQRWAFF